MQTGKWMKFLKKFNWDLLPIILMFAYLPLIVRMQMVQCPLKDYPWFPSNEERADFFVFWKGRFFLVLVVWMLIILTDRFLIRGKKEYSIKRFLPLWGYCLLSIVSTILSVNRNLSISGMTDQFETIWILLGYVIVTYYCWCVIESQTDIKIVISALAFGGCVQGLIGVSQIAGHSFWETEFGKFLMVPGAYDRSKIFFNYAQAEIHKVYLSLYNPNNAGVYLVMVVPVFTFALLAAKRKIWKCCLGVLTGVLMLCLIGTGSKTGLIILGIELLFVLLMPRIMKRKKRVCFLIIATAILLGVIGYDSMRGGRIAVYLRESIQRKERTYRLESIQTGKEGIFVCFAGKEFQIQLKKGSGLQPGISVHGADGREMELQMTEESKYHLKAKKFRPLTISSILQKGIPYIILEYRGIAWYFTNVTEKGNYSYVTQYGKLSDMTVSDSVFPKSWDTLFTYRGYIWGRTLPLLKDCLFWGTGPDTFTVVFPQNDYLAKARLENRFFGEILSKPHNMYLQTALQTGILSLICLIIFWGRYFVDFYSTYRIKGNVTGEVDYLSTGIFLGLIGYFIAGLTNDSTLVTAPVFWGMLGVGMASNRMRARTERI